MLKRKDIARTRKLCLRKLGPHAKRRFNICVSAEKNWDGYGAEPLNEASLLSLQRFLKGFPSTRLLSDVGVITTFFLDTEGRLELLWTQGPAVVENYSIMEMTFYDASVRVTILDDEAQCSFSSPEKAQRLFEVLYLLAFNMS